MPSRSVRGSRGPFRLRYNLLAMAAALLSGVNSILSIRALGLSPQNDVLFISSLVILTLSMISMFVTEQFQIFYTDALKVSPDAAEALYSSVATVASLVQAVLVAVAVTFLPGLLSLFAKGFDPARLAGLRFALVIQLDGFLFLPANTLNAIVLNAHQRFSMPFAMQLILPAATMVSYVAMIAAKSNDILPLLIVTSASAAAIFAVQAVGIRRLGLRFRPRLTSDRMGAYLWNSATMRLGHNINNMLVQPLVSNILAALPAGNASAYSFGQKFVTLLNAIAIGPNQSVLKAEISRLWVEGNVPEIKHRILLFYKSTLVIFIPMMAATYLAMPAVLGFVSSGAISGQGQSLVRGIFLASSIWTLQVVLEAPFVQVSVAARKSLFFILENLVNIAIIFAFVALFRSRLGLMVIPLGFIAGQVWNNSLNVIFALRLMGRRMGPGGVQQ